MLVVLFLFGAATTDEADVEVKRPCSAPEFRQFDFWLGDWDVVSAAGRKSHNRITSIQDGCAVLEEYDTPSGYRGTSINYYDSAKGKWFQSWMDNQGHPIHHSGGIEDGKLVLVDDPDGESINRTTWTPLEDGRVRQHWQVSRDAGETWGTVFDGTYTRREQDPRAEVRAREAAFAKSMADRDPAAFATFLDPEAIFLSSSRVLRGAVKIAEGWAGFFESPEAPFSWEPEQVEVLDSGRLAISTGPVKDPAGKKIGTFVSTWRRTADGQWRVVLDTGCSCD